MAKEKVKLLIQTRLTDGKQVRVKPVLSRNTPKATKEGLWAVVDGKETPVQGTYVLRYRPQPRAHRVWESVGRVCALDDGTGET